MSNSTLQEEQVMWWIIGSVVLVVIAGWLYWELRMAGRSKHDPTRDTETNYAIIDAQARGARNQVSGF